jgi:D-aminopeptidase
MKATRTRARDLGLSLPGTPGLHNAITDVPGVEVGFSTIKSLAAAAGDRQIYTGVTAVLPRGHSQIPSAVWAGQFDLNGNGEMTGTHWIADAGYFLGPVCLTNTHSIGIVHHAAVGWMIEQYAEHFRYHAWAMPVVAETYDGLVSDINGRHIEERHALEALRNAHGGAVEEGNIGGGAGMSTYGSRAERERARAAAPSARTPTPWGSWCNPTSVSVATSRYSVCRWACTCRTAWCPPPPAASKAPSSCSSPPMRP